MAWETGDRFKLITIGNSGVGKTALLKRWTLNRYESNPLTTLGAEFMTKKVNIESKPVEVVLWDTAGQEQYRAITKAFFRGSHGVVIAFSLADRSTYDAIVEWHEILSRELGARMCPIVIAGNKCDLVNERVVSEDDLQKMADRLHVPYFECSACTGEGVDDMFTAIAQLAIRAAQTADVRQEPKLVESSEDKGGCC